MQELFQLFDSIGILENSTRDYIGSALKRVELEKKDVILKEGATSRAIGFIEKGVIRSYRHKRGREMTTWLMREGDIFVALRSFFLQQPATETIEALEPCIIHNISYDQFSHINKTWPSFQRHRAELLQKYYLLSEEREAMRQQGAYDRFCFLMKYQPDLLGRVSDKYLASYLGITPGTYSLQKNEYAKKAQKKRS